MIATEKFVWKFNVNRKLKFFSAVKTIFIEYKIQCDKALNHINLTNRALWNIKTAVFVRKHFID